MLIFVTWLGVIGIVQPHADSVLTIAYVQGKKH